jgi:hypothetical protein
MDNELVVQEKGITPAPSHEIGSLNEKLKRSGYYESVQSPESYLEGTNNQAQSQDLELEKSSQGEKVSKSKKEQSPLSHWNTSIKKHFMECSDEQKQAWLDSYKIIEKGFKKQISALKYPASVGEYLLAKIAPFEEALKTNNLNALTYIDSLLQFDKMVGEDPVGAVARLVINDKVTYQEIYDAIPRVLQENEGNASIEKKLAPLKDEINRLKMVAGQEVSDPQSFEEVNNVANDILEKIQAFYAQTDPSGKLKYPLAQDNMAEIVERLEDGENLDDAYYNTVGTGAPSATNSDSQIEDDYVPFKPKRTKNALDLEKEMLMNKLNRMR